MIKAAKMLSLKLFAHQAFWRVICNFFLLILIYSCTNDRCIDADDFGFAKFTVSSRYPKTTTVINNKGDKSTLNYIEDYQGKQAGAWLDSGYELNGQPLTIMVKNWSYDKKRNNATASLLSAWSPWFGKDKNVNSLPRYLYNLRSCRFANNDTCGLAQTPDDTRILNAPCLMKQGVGLYGLLTTQKAPDPNASAMSRYNPDTVTGLTFHVGDPGNLDTAKLYDIDNSFKRSRKEARANAALSLAGGIIVKQDIEKYKGGKLYFKILDTDYSDNAGQYIVVIKSGVRNVGFDPFAQLADKFKEMFFGSGADNLGLVPQLYNNILKQPGFRKTVSALLSMYIMFMGMGFLIGITKFTKHELFNRIFKVLIISVLISVDTSWQFFYDNFFNLFINGLQQLVGYIQEAATGGKTQGGESIIALIFAEQTFSKLLALLLMDFSGFIYCIVFLCLMGFIVAMYLKAYILYITSLMMIGIIISMAPIFLCFLLFQATKYLFDNWLKQLITYSFQPIILFASLAFLGNMVRDEIYNSLGFKVCAIPIIDIGVTEKPLLSMYYPQPATPAFFNNNLVQMSVPKPIDIYDDKGKIIKSYKAYEKIDYRYPDIPFLDPEMDPAIGDDKARITKFKDKGSFIQFEGLVYLILIVWILHYFNESTIDIANSIIGSGAQLTSMKGITSSLNHNLLSRPADQMKDMLQGRLEKNSAYRSAVAAYRTAESAASYASTAVEKNLELGLSKFASVSQSSILLDKHRVAIARKFGWIANATGMTRGINERAHIRGEFDQELKKKLDNYNFRKTQLKKGVSDMYNDLNNVAAPKENILDKKDEPLEEGADKQKPLTKNQIRTNKVLDGLANMISAPDPHGTTDKKLYEAKRKLALQKKHKKEQESLEKWSRAEAKNNLSKKESSRIFASRQLGAGVSEEALSLDDDLLEKSLQVQSGDKVSEKVEADVLPPEDRAKEDRAKEDSIAYGEKDSINLQKDSSGQGGDLVNDSAGRESAYSKKLSSKEKKVDLKNIYSEDKKSESVLDLGGNYKEELVSKEAIDGNDSVASSDAGDAGNSQSQKQSKAYRDKISARASGDVDDIYAQSLIDDPGGKPDFKDAHKEQLQQNYQDNLQEKHQEFKKDIANEKNINPKVKR